MLLRVFLIVAILAGIGSIVVSQLVVKDHVTKIINERNDWHSKHDAENARANKAEKGLKDAKDQLTQTKKKLDAANKQVAAEQTKTANETRRADGLTEELVAVKAARNEAQQKLSRYELTGLQPEQVRTTLEELKKSTAQNAAIEEEKRIMGRRIKQLEAQVAQIFGDREQEPDVPLPPGLKGKVMVVDPKWDFVVLDIGAKQEVLQNGIMMVSREGKLVGKVKIVTVYPERSIANVIPGIWKVGEIQEGDQVLYLP